MESSVRYGANAATGIVVDRDLSVGAVVVTNSVRPVACSDQHPNSCCLAMTLIPVTVVIPVKNEETNLPTCLAKAKLGAFTEILVVDSS